MREYTASADMTVTAAGTDTTIWEIDPAADHPVILMGYSFDVTSEVAEAQEEWLRMRITRYVGGTATTITGTAVTPRPLDENNTVAMSANVETNSTTLTSSSGTAHIMGYFGVPVRGGYGPVFLPPEYRTKVMGVAQSVLAIDMLNTLADDITLVSTLWLGEE